MGIYSFLLMLALGVSAPWWLWRMATSGRYREGLGERLGRVPESFWLAGDLTSQKRDGGNPSFARVVWVHAVSVGEVLAAERLIGELKEALPGWVVAVSTTTATGQKIARERLVGSPVFYLPLDFAFAVRAWLGVLRPGLVVLVESELWPRMLVECERMGVPVVVVNARVSDRSLPRYMRLRWLWKRLMGKVRVFLAQGEESAERLRRIGAERVEMVGNLKFDLPKVKISRIAERLAELRGACRVVVAGSTHEGEEEKLLAAWPQVLEGAPDMVLVLAPRHPERFEHVVELVSRSGFEWRRASCLVPNYRDETAMNGAPKRLLLDEDAKLRGGSIVVLDTVGDLASVYCMAQMAFIGGSLVPKGGHNPLEAARFGVPIEIGPYYENFREIVDGMLMAHAIHVVKEDLLATVLIGSPRDGQERGRRAKQYYERNAGATAKTVAALVEMVREREG